MKKLVISEKSNAARRISTILSEDKPTREKVGSVSAWRFDRDGDEYYVVGLSGHIIELDYPKEMNDWRSVDLKDLVYASPEKRVRSNAILGAVDHLSRECPEIIIATDFDREGELIGLETIKQLDIPISRVKRARFSALTKAEIEGAFENLTAPDERLAEAAEARQVIDLAWGAVLTRFISISSHQVGRNFLSAGRVQSPTLALIVDRHQEIESFEPKPYWNVRADMEGDFRVTHASNPFWEEAESDGVMERCGGAGSGTVTSYECEDRDEYPPAPFSTTMMLTEANRIGIRPAEAMKIAESLYTSGYISYPRTDNTVYPRSLSLKGILNKLMDTEFSKEAGEILAQETIRPSRGKRMTTDHPPIHPVGALKKSKIKDARKWKIYELVCRRFLATVAPSAKVRASECAIDIAGEPFEGQGRELLEKGWRKYYPYWKFKASNLPELAEGQSVPVASVDRDAKFTEPPRRYSQGNLLQEMEKRNLGTKSTRHDIIGKLYDRNYVEGNDLVPTLSGIAVTESLEAHAPMIVASEMTAALEDDMESISNGELTLEQVVKDSQDMLNGSLEALRSHESEIGDGIRDALHKQDYVGKCPVCQGNLMIKVSRKGTRFVGCDNYPKCNKSYFLPRGAKSEPTGEACPECGAPTVRVIRRGNPVTVQCLDPECKTNVDRDILGDCPECDGGRMRLLHSRAGKRFAGCTSYPDCKNTYPLPPRGRIEPVGEPCASCGAPMIRIGASENARVRCINPECPTNERKRKKADDQ